MTICKNVSYLSGEIHIKHNNGSIEEEEECLHFKGRPVLHEARGITHKQEVEKDEGNGWKRRLHPQPVFNSRIYKYTIVPLL